MQESLALVADDVLIQSIRSFRDTVEVLQQEGTTEADRWYCKEIRQALAAMRTEARRRGLGLPEEAKS